ncbi:MAG: cell division protein ZapE [Alphaproteobacteria bacterium]
MTISFESIINNKVLIEDKSITLDNSQNEVLKELLNFNKQIIESCKILNIFNRKSPSSQAIYLWGAVGRGKSMLMKLFYNQVNLKKNYIHFHAFMLEIHDKLRNIRKNYQGDPIKILAKNLAKDIRLLCLDELEIKDIADAMIIGRLFKELFESKIFIVITSNCHPSKLYENGLKRENFLEFIDLIEEKFNVICLNSKTDYRIGLLKSHKIYFQPLNQENTLFVQKLLDDLSNNIFKKEVIEVLGRNLVLEKSFNIVDSEKNGLCVGFNEICEQNLGTADYEAIAKKFQIIFLTDIPILYRENRNEILRFIKLIDILYENKNIIICSAEALPNELYKEGEHIFEFKRTVSRLEEMQSDDYIRSLI